MQMKRIENKVYGDLFLAALTDGWYVELNTEYQKYYKLNDNKIVAVTCIMPDVVKEKLNTL